MSNRGFPRAAARCGWTLALSVVLGASLSGFSQAGNFGRGSAVGGVSIDTSGALRNASVDETQELLKARAELVNRFNDRVDQASPLRKVSLRKLEAYLADRQAKAQMPLITEDVNYLAGLTRIQYVFVYPEERDIVLVGPSEPLKVNEDGAVVGADSGQPVLHIDHLLVALRTARSAAQTPITCSIDPEPAGIQALQAFLNTRPAMNANTVSRVEQLLGPQRVTITGVSPESYLARIMVAADYRMKRLAMGLDQAPKKYNLPSYLQMMSAGSAGLQNATPRWWLAPNYDALVRDPDGLAWELGGASVKCLTEDSYITEVTGVRPSGKTSPTAQKWADMLTEKYPALSAEYPIFGELRNVMDLAVVGALIAKEGLLRKAGLELPILLGTQNVLEVDKDLPAPKTIASEASVIKKGRNWVISAAGGVELSSWQVADNNKLAEGAAGEALAKSRSDVMPAADTWWWD